MLFEKTKINEKEAEDGLFKKITTNYYGKISIWQDLNPQQRDYENSHITKRPVANRQRFGDRKLRL